MSVSETDVTLLPDDSAFFTGEVGAEPTLEELRDEIDPHAGEAEMEGVECDLQERVRQFKETDECLRDQVQTLKRHVDSLDALLEGEQPTDPLASLRMMMPDQLNYTNGPEMAVFSSIQKQAKDGFDMLQIKDRNPHDEGVSDAEIDSLYEGTNQRKKKPPQCKTAKDGFDLLQIQDRDPHDKGATDEEIDSLYQGTEERKKKPPQSKTAATFSVAEVWGNKEFSVEAADLAEAVQKAATQLHEQTGAEYMPHGDNELESGQGQDVWHVYPVTPMPSEVVPAKTAIFPGQSDEYFTKVRYLIDTGKLEEAWRKMNDMVNDLGDGDWGASANLRYEQLRNEIKTKYKQQKNASQHRCEECGKELTYSDIQVYGEGGAPADAVPAVCEDCAELSAADFSSPKKLGQHISGKAKEASPTGFARYAAKDGFQMLGLEPAKHKGEEQDEKDYDEDLEELEKLYGTARESEPPQVTKESVKTADNKVQTQPGACKICQPKSGQIIPPGGDRPPFHDNCKCEVVEAAKRFLAKSGHLPCIREGVKNNQITTAVQARNALIRLLQESGIDFTRLGTFPNPYSDTQRLELHVKAPIQQIDQLVSELELSLSDGVTVSKREISGRSESVVSIFSPKKAKPRNTSYYD